MNITAVYDEPKVKSYSKTQIPHADFNRKLSNLSSITVKGLVKASVAQAQESKIDSSSKYFDIWLDHLIEESVESVSNDLGSVMKIKIPSKAVETLIDEELSWELVQKSPQLDIIVNVGVGE